MSSGSIQFVADPSQLVAASAEARQSVASVAATAEQAKQKIVASYQAQVAAAKEAGATQRQLEAITSRSANTLASVTEDSAKRYINAIDRMEDRTRKFNAARSSLTTSIPQSPVSQFSFGGYGSASKEAEELSNAIKDVGESAGYSVAPSVRFGAVLRGMEGGFSRNVRAAEYFGASLKFLQPIMSGAFEVVGAATLVYALYEMGKNAYNAFENIVLLRDAIKGLNQLQINVDSTVTKNQDAAEASVEAILNSTQGKTAADRQKYAYAQKKPLDNSDYFYSKEFSGLGSNIKADYEKQYKSVAPSDIPNALASIKTELQNLNTAKGAIKTGGGFVKNVGGYGPSSNQDPTSYYDARIKAATQIQSVLQSGSDARSAALQADQTAIPHDQAEEAKKKAQEAKSARQQALAAQREDSAKAIAAQNADLLDWQAYQDRSKLDEVLYWSSIVALRNDGSARAVDATKKYNDAQKALHRENAEAMKTAISGFTGEYMKDFYANSGLSSPDRKSLSQSGTDAGSYIASLRESIALKKQDSDAIAENAIQMALATGQMTKLDAARATAALHQQQYADSLKDLNDQRGAISSDPTISSLQRSAQLQDNANQKKSLSDNYGIQQQLDAQASSPASSSMSVGFANAINSFVTASRNGAEQMQSLVTNTLQGLNQQIVSAMSGQKTNFKQFGAGVFRSVSGTALEKGEGAILGAFGGGKLGASQGNPMWVKMADATSSVAGSAGSFLSNIFGGGSKGPGQSGLNTALSISNGAQDADSDAGGIATVASTALQLLPFLATGGDFTNGAVVGENGPEILTGSGKITSNRNLRSMLGSGNSGHTINIDASGSTDPAQTRVQVMRGIQAAAPHIAASTINAQREQNLRKPPSARR